MAKKDLFQMCEARRGVVRLNVGGLQAQFLADTPERLRVLECMGGAGGEEELLELFVSEVRAGETAYDVGSNVGLYTVFLAKAVGGHGRVVAFEPEPDTYQMLLRNVKDNGLTNVCAFQCAPGAANTTAPLYRGPDIGNLTLLPPRNRSPRILGTVDVVVGDDLIRTNALPPPQAVKIDVEGYEHAVICGLGRTLANPVCRLVCCEVHPRLVPAGTKPGAIISHLRRLGFSQIDTYRRWDGSFHAVGQKGRATGRSLAVFVADGQSEAAKREAVDAAGTLPAACLKDVGCELR
jgi:FkbM family methyltransferase